jgi:hypothetical protein
MVAGLTRRAAMERRQDATSRAMSPTALVDSDDAMGLAASDRLRSVGFVTVAGMRYSSAVGQANIAMTRRHEVFLSVK